MKKLLTFLAITLLGLGLTKEAKAGVNYEVQLIRKFRALGFLDVDIQIRNTGLTQFVLGTSSFVFNYNAAALRSPITRPSSLIGPWSSGTDLDYGSVSLSFDSTAGFAGLSVIWDPQDDCDAAVVADTFRNVGTVRLRIADYAELDSLAWRNVGINTQVFKVQNPPNCDPSLTTGQQEITSPQGTFIPPPDQLLPIQLASFTANVVRDNEVEVAWHTVSETNNYGFEIYRKRGETGEWKKMGFVEGHGTTLAPQSYSYADRSVSFGKYFYRIKQIDLDGKSETFPQMEVSVGAGPDKFVLTQNYPNPFNPGTLIEFVVPKSGFTTMKVYNILGQEVAKLFEGNAEAGKIYTATFDASRLASGLYFYRLQSAGKVETKRMLLLK